MSKKIACCINGLPANYIIEHLQRLVKYKDSMDFFIFFWDVLDEELKTRINKLLQPKEIEYHKLIEFPFDAKYKEPDKQGKKQNALSMFYGISRVQQMRKEYEKKHEMQYDIIIRYRYDIYLLDDFMLTLHNINKLLLDTCIVIPWEHHHIGICDQIWFARQNVMNRCCNLFDWIKNNIDTLYFVNENILCRFIMNENINIKCANLRYILIRDNMLEYTYEQNLNEYEKQLSLPWVKACPEKTDYYYQQYIMNKNISANNIYFLNGNKYYQDYHCKIYNSMYKKYMYVSTKNFNSGIKGDEIATHFIIRVNNSYLINIILNSLLIKSTMYLTNNNVNNKLVCRADGNYCMAQFFLIKTNKTTTFKKLNMNTNDLQAQNKNEYINYPCYQLMINYIPAEVLKKDNVYVNMDEHGNIYASGNKNMMCTEWCLIPDSATVCVV